MSVSKYLKKLNNTLHGEESIDKHINAIETINTKQWK